jgi:hypothetical protein
VIVKKLKNEKLKYANETPRKLVNMRILIQYVWWGAHST